MKISIVIPTYEAQGRGVGFLDKLLGSIESQTYKNYEVVISDHSADDVICDSLGKWNDEMSLVYYRNELGRGNASINMNVGMKQASGGVIKIMHMDDWFCNNNALQWLCDATDAGSLWGAFTFNHFYENTGELRREITPSFSNTMGCPSTSFFPNDTENPNLFDEELIVINDHDMHHNLLTRYGEPVIIKDVCVTIRMSDQQVSAWIGKRREIEEWEYFNRKICNE